MIYKETFIKGLFIIEPITHKDERGLFLESFNFNDFKKKIDSNIFFLQDNESYSKKNVIRGLHFQKPPFEQAKLVRCTYGKVLDVALDIRTCSPTFGKYFSIELSGKNKRQLFIPRGFAHGFSVLSKFAIFSYKLDNVYSSINESGIKWNDPNLNIDWKINVEDALVSNKDNLLKDFNKTF